MKKEKSTKSNTQAKNKTKAAKQAGRPALFNTPEELQAKIDKYFDTCKPKLLLVDGKTIKDKSG